MILYQGRDPQKRIRIRIVSYSIHAPSYLYTYRYTYLCPLTAVEVIHSPPLQYDIKSAKLFVPHEELQ